MKKILCLLGIIALMAGTAQAATYVWNGAGSNTRVGTADNWTPSLVQGNDSDLIFTTAGNDPGSTFVDMTQRSITFSNDIDAAYGFGINRSTSFKRYLIMSSDTGTSTLEVQAGAEGDIEITGTFHTDSGEQNAIVLSNSLNVIHNGSGSLTLEARITGINDIAKSGSGELILGSAQNDYTGNTTVSAGTLTLSDNAQLLFDIDGASTNNSLSGSGIVNLNGDFTFDLTDATTAVDDSWMIVDTNTLTETFGATFSVIDFTDAGSNTWTKIIDASKFYEFSESTGLLTVREGAANETPAADPQSVYVWTDTPKDITLVGTDPDSGPSNLTYTVESQPSNGSLTTNGALPDLIYTPGLGYEGSDSFTFSVFDGLTNSDIATVTIMVTNEVPIASAQSVEVYRDDSVIIPLAATDGDAGPSNLTYTVETQPANGTLTGTAPALTYTPTSGYIGADSFTFTVNDGLADSAPGTISITVLNNLPVADPKFTLTEPDTLVAITLTGSDPEGSNLTYSVASQPAHGILGGTEPNLTYTPTNGYTGADSFTYTANDGEDDSAAATVSIQVSTNGFSLSFINLDASTNANTLTAGGIAADVTGVTNGLDYVYSVSYTGVDIDGDASNDELTFDVRVKAWTNGTTELDLIVAGSTNTASATIGTSPAAVNISDGARFTAGGNTQMENGESLEFIIENLAVSLTDGSKSGTAASTGFNGVQLVETHNGNSHNTIFGEGTGLLGWAWNADFDASVDVGEGPLYVSADDTAATDATRPFHWGVGNVDFDIQITLDAAGGVADISLAVGSGGDLVFSWAGGGTYNVETNANLLNSGGWGTLNSGASSPVTNAIGSEASLFYRLSE